MRSTSLEHAALQGRVASTRTRYREVLRRLRALDGVVWLDTSARTALREWHEAMTVLCDFEQKARAADRR